MIYFLDFSLEGIILKCVKNEVYFSVNLNIYLFICVSSNEKNNPVNIRHNPIIIVIIIPPIERLKYFKRFL